MKVELEFSDDLASSMVRFFFVDAEEIDNGLIINFPTEENGESIIGILSDMVRFRRFGRFKNFKAYASQKQMRITWNRHTEPDNATSPEMESK